MLEHISLQVMCNACVKYFDNNVICLKIIQILFSQRERIVSFETRDDEVYESNSCKYSYNEIKIDFV